MQVMMEAIASLKTQLNLSASQQSLWDSAIAASKSAHQATRANRQALHQTMTDELAKAEPNLAALASQSDQIHASNQTIRNQARDEWLKLYAALSGSQKSVVKGAIQQKMVHAGGMMKRIRERFNGPG